MFYVKSGKAEKFSYFCWQKKNALEAPKYLLQRKFLMESVAFVVVFSVLFLLTYHPFSTTSWLGLAPGSLLPTVLFYLSAICILLLSKGTLMVYQLRHTISVRKYLVWVLGEFIVIAVVYLLYTQYWFHQDIPFTFGLVFHTSLCVAMILTIPYIIITLLASNKARGEELDALKLELANMSNQESEPEKESGGIIHFYDYSGVLRISIPSESIFYIASQDNYVEIQYELEGNLLNYLMRCRTTRLEKQLENTSMVRCHRSFIVNLDNVSGFRREHSKAFLVLRHPDAKKIPVSKSYYKTVAERLGMRASQ